MILANVYKASLIRVPYNILSGIINDTDLFIDILKNNEWNVSETPKKTNPIPNTDCRVLFHPRCSYESSFSACGRLPHYNPILHKEEYEIEKIDEICYEDKRKFIAKIIDNELDLERVVTLINIFKEVHKLDKYVGFESFVLDYCGYKNNFALFARLNQVILVSYVYTITDYVKYFIFHQNVEAIKYAMPNGMESIVGEAIKLKANKVFDIYYDPTKIEVHPYEIIYLINKSIRYRNLHTFNKILDNQKCANALLQTKCKVNERITNLFDAIETSCGDDRDFMKAYSKIKSKILPEECPFLIHTEGNTIVVSLMTVNCVKRIDDPLVTNSYDSLIHDYYSNSERPVFGSEVQLPLDLQYFD
jgi:hypothetical protein